MKRMAEVSNVNVIIRELEDEEEIMDPNAIDKKLIPECVEIFEINGPFFFSAAKKFKDQMLAIEELPKVRIIRMGNVPAIDANCLQTLKDFYHYANGLPKLG